MPLLIVVLFLGNGLKANKKSALPKGERKKNTLIFDGKKYEIHGEEVRERAHFGKGKGIGYIDGDVVRKPKTGFEQQGEALFTIEE